MEKHIVVLVSENENVTGVVCTACSPAPLTSKMAMERTVKA